ncbi:hypothetical protein ACLJJ6_08965 [Pediococcus siamensis]|uniref:hypothetical protein n=1 Tax=Pediococcus siamensis TaxID=381829 RepID=UPI0039A3F1C4
MYLIPSSAFETINNYSSNKDKTVLRGFTQLRVAINGQIFPRVPKKQQGKAAKATRVALGLGKPAEIAFTNDEMKVYNVDGEVARTERIEDFEFVQFGALRTFPFQFGSMLFVPSYTYSLTLVVGVGTRHYYILNPNFTVFQLLAPILKEKGIKIEDPFDIADLPSDSKRENYFNKFYEKRAEGTTYPIQAKWVPLLV